MSGGCLFDSYGYYHGPIVFACNDIDGDGFLAIYPVFDVSANNIEVFPKDISIESNPLEPYWVDEGYSYFFIIILSHCPSIATEQ